MILIEIKAFPPEIQKDTVLKKAFKNLKVWSRNVRGKFVAQKDDIISALRRDHKEKAAKIIEDKTILEIVFGAEECSMTKC